MTLIGGNVRFEHIGDEKDAVWLAFKSGEFTTPLLAVRSFDMKKLVTEVLLKLPDEERVELLNEVSRVGGLREKAGVQSQ